jgi:RNA polymerase sigma factor (sigma-70 family)
MEMARPVLRVAAREGALVPMSEPPSRTFDAFFDEESGTLFRRMWLVTRHRQEAEEIMQDAFLAVFERWDRVSAMEDPTGYLYRTAFNLWHKRLRRAARAVRGILGPLAPTDEFEAAEARTVLGDALAELAPRQRAAIVLTEILGYTSEEAGSILGIRAVTARVLASQARAALRKELVTTDE